MTVASKSAVHFKQRLLRYPVSEAGSIKRALIPGDIAKILIYGAGVIGTLYAARLHDGGNRVTVVARGQRLADIRRYGLALEDLVGHGRSTTQVDTTEQLGPNDQFDAALIAVRRDQVASVMPELTANYRIPTLIFMLNNPTGSSELAQALGRDRVLLGFPGAGGTRDGHLVRYAMIAQ